MAEMMELLFTAGRIVVPVLCVIFLSRFFLRKSIPNSGKLKTRLQDQQGVALPPGPRPLPILGNLAALGALPHRSLHKMATTYGPLMYLRLGSVPAVVVTSAEMAEEVLKTHDRVFASRPNLMSSQIIAYGGQNFGFLPYGDQWRSSRKLFTTRLITGKRVEDTQRMRKEGILLLLRSMVKKSEGGRGVPLFNELFQMSANILSRLMFSKDMFGSSESVASSGSEFQHIVTEVFTLFGAFNIGDFIPFLKRFDLQGFEKRMRAVHVKMDGFLQGLLDARLKELSQAKDDQSEADDMMTALLTHPADETDSKPRTAEQIKAMMLDSMLAGTDSTVLTLEWTMSELLKNPDTMRMAVEELDRVVGRARLVEDADLPRLPYLQAVVKESMRLHPAAALLLPHESTADCTVGGYFAPAGTRLMVNIWAIGRDPTLWERPLHFWPSRFLPDQVDGKIDIQGQDFKLLPFGSGRRSCPGRSLALRVVHYALAVMLQSCHWNLPASIRPEDLDMSETFALGVFKAVKLEVIATPRLPSSVVHLSP